MTHNWQAETLRDEDAVFDLLTQLRGGQWLCRGQPEPYNSLFPKIDRKPRDKLSRLEKLRLERERINIFRSTARFLHPNEQGALDHDQDNIALMILRHYGVPTRLLDWSKSPYVAAYFAALNNDTKVGEIWTFDEPLYEQKGKKQWLQWPETTMDGSGNHDKFKAELTEFTVEEPPDWFICGFYKPDFPRQYAQESFDGHRDEGKSLSALEDVEDTYVCHNCVGDGVIKKEIRGHGQRQRCAFCNCCRRCVSLSTVADRLDRIYQEIVAFA